MRDNLVPACLAILLLSGCASPGGAPTDDAAAPTSGMSVSDGGTGRPLLVLRGTYTLHLSEANTLGLRTGVPPFLGVPSENCLGLVAGVEVVRGYANATWDAQSLVTEDLLLALDYGPGERAMVTGASTLSLGLGGITFGSVQGVAGTSDGFEGSLLTVNLVGDAGAAVDQQVDLDLWLEYHAGEPLVPQAGFTCSPFTLPIP